MNRKKRGEEGGEDMEQRYQNANRVVLFYYFSFSMCICVCTTRSTVKHDFT